MDMKPCRILRKFHMKRAGNHLISLLLLLLVLVTLLISNRFDYAVVSFQLLLLCQFLGPGGCRCLSTLDTHC